LVGQPEPDIPLRGVPPLSTSVLPPALSHLRIVLAAAPPRIARLGVPSGNTLTYYFCPTCGSTVYWENEDFPGIVAVAIGNFADPNFPAPTRRRRFQGRHFKPCDLSGQNRCPWRSLRDPYGPGNASRRKPIQTLRACLVRYS